MSIDSWWFTLVLTPHSCLRNVLQAVSTNHLLPLGLRCYPPHRHRWRRQSSRHAKELLLCYWGTLFFVILPET